MGERETALQKNALYFSTCLPFLQAAIDVLFKVVWVSAARRPGFRDLAKATITSTRRSRKAELH